MDNTARSYQNDLRLFTLREKPTLAEIQEFREHVRATGSPETFPRITTTEATQLDDAMILTEFQVNRKKRPELDEAPCPICSPRSPKFLAGYLVWFPSEKCIRAIGKECGKRIYDRWDREVRAFKDRQRQEARIKYLEENFHKVPEILEKLLLAHEQSVRHRDIWLEFRRKCPEIAQALRGEMSNGYLSVARKRNIRSGVATVSSSGVSDHYEEKIGSVSGHTAVKSTFRHPRDCEKEIQAFSVANFGSDKSATFLKIQQMSLKEHKSLEKIIKQAKKRLQKTIDANNDFIAFFEYENIQTIDRWAANENATLNFEISLNSSLSRLKVSSPKHGTEFINLAGLQ